MSRPTANPIYFVCQQAAIRLPDLSTDERLNLLAGLKLMLPISEFEQCQVIHWAIVEQEQAKRRIEEAQLILGDMLSDTKAAKAA